MNAVFDLCSKFRSELFAETLVEEKHYYKVNKNSGNVLNKLPYFKSMSVYWCIEVESSEKLAWSEYAERRPADPPTARLG